MEQELFNEINPYIRYVHFLKNCNNDNHHLPWRQLYDYEFLFVTKGSIIVETKTEKYEVCENNIHIMPPGKFHTRYFPQNATCDYYSVHLDLFYNPYLPDFSAKQLYSEAINNNSPTSLTKELLTRQSHLKKLKTPSIISIQNSENLKELFSNLLTAFQSPVFNYRNILIKSIFLQILLNILQSCKESDIPFFSIKKNLHEQVIDEYIEYVQNNFNQNIKLEDYLKNKGISPSYFSKVFRREKNCSPNEFLINERINAAKQLLAEGKNFIYEIATMVGIPNSYYFTRLFTKRVGMSPLQYIQKHKSK